MLLKAQAWHLPVMCYIPKRQEGNLHVSRLFLRQMLIWPTSSELIIKSCSGRQQISRLHPRLISLIMDRSLSLHCKGTSSPPALMDVINCWCEAVMKICSSNTCSCHSLRLFCTQCTACVGEAMCLNPLTKHSDHENVTRYNNEEEDGSTEVIEDITIRERMTGLISILFV